MAHAEASSEPPNLSTRCRARSRWDIAAPVVIRPPLVVRRALGSRFTCGYLRAKASASHHVVVAGWPSSTPASANAKVPTQLAARIAPSRACRRSQASAGRCSINAATRLSSESSACDTPKPGTMTTCCGVLGSPAMAATGGPNSVFSSPRGVRTETSKRERRARALAVPRTSVGPYTAEPRTGGNARTQTRIVTCVR